MSIIKCLNKPVSTVLKYFFGSHEQKRKVITLSTSFLHIVQYLFLWQSKIYIHAISSISWPNQKHNSSNEAQMDTKSQMLWTSLSYAWSISQFSRGFIHLFIACTINKTFCQMYDMKQCDSFDIKSWIWDVLDWMWGIENAYLTPFKKMVCKICYSSVSICVAYKFAW